MTRFSNTYSDPDRAEAYASVQFPGTYGLAFRDIPALCDRHVTGTRALDFGCGAGRSTRLLRGLGFDVTGVDISAAMIERARGMDPGAPSDAYRLIDDDPADLPPGPFDLILAAYPFDNIPGGGHRIGLMAGLAERLAAYGRLVLIASSPELYVNEWASFTTAAFPENAGAGSGEVVRIVMKVGGDERPVDDFRWFDRDYRALFDAAGLEVLETHRPRATGEEGEDWVSETEVPPWVVYVAGPAVG